MVGSTRMLPSTVSGKRTKRRPSGWLTALGGSVVAHVGILAALFWFGSLRIGATAEPMAPPDPTWSVLELTTIALPVEIAGQEISDPPLADEAAPRARPWDAHQGERDNPVARTVAPANADGRDRQAPAPDRGQSGGAPLAAAYRLDSSTLRARLTDGARVSQPARLRISRHRASPQAIRQEPRIGIGDSVRTVVPTHAPSPSPAPATLARALGGEPAGAASADAPATRAETPPADGLVAARTTLVHTVGPLDAERGARRFDVERPGRAADDQTQRAASDELHPGLTDFTRASALRAAAAVDGRGPATTPGAVARPSAGSAPAEFGARDPQAAGLEVSDRTLDRRYQRYIQEVSQRVRRIREFPRSLALRLEQGETIVQFVVGIDGRLGDGPRVMKSSGFEEFDAAAVRAVRRAAPFPPMPDPGSARPLPVSLRVTFDNPVVR
jgi:TonB family protein